MNNRELDKIEDSLANPKTWKIFRVFHFWRQGQVREHFSKSTLTRYRKILKQYGIDILVPPIKPVDTEYYLRRNHRKAELKRKAEERQRLKAEQKAFVALEELVIRSSKLTPLELEILRQMSDGNSWTFPWYEGWMVRSLNKTTRLGFTKQELDMTSKQWCGRMWRLTETGLLFATGLPQQIVGLKREIQMWDGR